MNNMVISVKAARINAKLTQCKVAELIGMTLNSYKLKENGLRRFYVDEMARLSKLFNIDMEFFFEAQCRKKTQNQSQRG